MRLTKQTSYALRILLHCALRPGEQVKAADIARAYNITEFNVLKIIPLLVQGGFVTTMRGRRGGMRLARPASEIRIGDIIRLTEETHIQADCFGQLQDACPILPAAPINRIFGNAVEAVHRSARRAHASGARDGASARPLRARTCERRGPDALTRVAGRTARNAHSAAVGPCREPCACLRRELQDGVERRALHLLLHRLSFGAQLRLAARRCWRGRESASAASRLISSRTARSRCSRVSSCGRIG
jgi:Rrf2 family protein